MRDSKFGRNMKVLVVCVLTKNSNGESFEYRIIELLGYACARQHGKIENVNN